MAKTIIITGAGGFVGQTLAKKLLTTYPDIRLILADVNKPGNPQPNSDNVETVAADLTNASEADSLLASSPEAIYILHGIMSSGSEANLELGLEVNFDSVRNLLDTIRQKKPGTKVIFTSSCAVFGRAAVKDVATETNVVPMPESSYGTQKLMIEYLINDYSRRGLIDGRVVRLPTIFVRAGAPTAAASSFVSGIVREPVHGKESILPVDPNIGIWLCSPRTLAHNLVHALELPAEKFEHFRTVLLPGYTATSAEILQALEKVAGKETRALVKEERDETTQRIVLSWPAKYDTSRARSLGFAEDVGLEQTIKDFVESEKAQSEDGTVPMTVRNAVPEDETAVVALWHACNLVASYNDPVADFHRALTGASSTVLVAENAEGNIKGSVMVGDDGHRGWLYYVASAPSERGKGVGRAMVDAGEEWLRERNVPKVMLIVRVTNTAVVKFYERLGYEDQPRVLMSKELNA